MRTPWTRRMILWVLLVLVLTGGGLAWWLWPRERPAGGEDWVEPVDPAAAEDWPRDQASPLDRLDPAHIPAEERVPGQPEELVAVLGTHRGAHGGSVYCVAFSPDARRLASGGGDGAVRLWDPTTLIGRATLDVKGETDERGKVVSLAFSADGDRLAGVATTKVVRSSWARLYERSKGESWVLLWDLSGGTATPTSVLHLPGETAYGATFSPDGALLAVGVGWGPGGWGGPGGKVRLFCLGPEGPEQLARLPGDDTPVTAVAFSPDGGHLAAGTSGGQVTLTAIPAADVLSARARYPRRLVVLLVLAVAVSLFLSFGLVVPGRRWSRPITWFYLRRRPLGGRRFLVGSVGLACVGGLCLAVWYFFTGGIPSLSPASTTKAHQGPVRALAFGPDGRSLATGGEDGGVALWSVGESGLTDPARAERFREPVNAIALAPDGRTLAASAGNQESDRGPAGRDWRVRLWAVRPDGLEERGALPESVGLVNALAFCPGGGPLASGSGHCTAGFSSEGVGWFCAVRLWDVDGRPREHVPRGDTPVRRAFQDAGRLASLSLPGAHLIWDLSGERPRLLARLGVSGAKHSAWVSADHTRALLLNLDSGRTEFSAWSLGPGGPRCKGTAAAEGTLTLDWAATPGLTRLVTWEKGAQVLKVWDAGGETLRELASLDTGVLAGSAGGHRAVNFSADGRHLVCRTEDGTLRLWALDGTSARPLLARPGPAERGSAAPAFTPDGRTLLAPEGGGGVRMWDLGGRQPREGPVLRGALAAVTDLDCSSDGCWLAVGGADARIELWDLAAPAPRRHAALEAVPGPEPTKKGEEQGEGIRWPTEVGFGKDGLTLWAAVHGQVTRFTDLPAAAPRRLVVPDLRLSLGDPDRTTTVCLGRSLLVAKHDGRRVGVWVVRDDRATKVRELWLPSPASGVWLTPDGRHLATFNANGTVYVLRLWDRDAGP